ncbi:NAD(P)/FAD-dependent oxidoreductase [Acidihalobacter ferrooxydans]|uniref:FAD-dependent oxidoreductase n=1 Tax=Acidihalobacter ferrooxydans TaxID=1765967 RepID=A0A1P8UD76_9GAMM|nr:FAD-binding oxidoreductase [Acidihalobacter ferrooxydans]APZ41790.1 FAD-dependent oxidoreductase [Acidihalobacter ferrooxydans]
MPGQPHVDSYYAATRNRTFDCPRLEGEETVDVCVIGAGITGCSTALHLAERGYRVAVLEGARIGWGASGRSGGQKLHGFACDLGVLKRQVGAEATRQLWDMSLEAVDLLDRLVARHAIDCDAAQGYLHAAIKPRQRRELLDWIEVMARDYDFHELDFVEGDALHAMIDSERYIAGVSDPRSGHIHPLNYTLGLAAAAERAGARFFEDSRVIRIERGAPAVVHTATGQVRAAHVVLCANAHLDGLEPRLWRRIMPVGTYIIATEPLGAARAEALLPGHAAVADSNFVLDYFRRSADHRLLFGGRVSYSTLEPLSIAQSMRARMLKVFPALADTRIDYAWGGYVAITQSRAPHFGRLADNIFYAQGFSGHGIALTGLAGKLMAEAVAGTAERFDVFARIPHLPFPGGRWFRTPALVLATTWFRLRDLLP